MELSDYLALFSIVIATLSAIYTIKSNTKKYELTYQRYQDVLLWHSKTVEILISLKLNKDNNSKLQELLIQLSSSIENGRFFFLILKEVNIMINANLMLIKVIEI